MLLVLTSAFIPSPYPLSSCSLQCPLCLQASVSSCVRRAASTGPTSTAPAPAAEAVARGSVDEGYSQLTGVSLRTRSRPWSGPRLVSASVAACDAPLLCTPPSRGVRRRITRGAHKIQEFTRTPPRASSSAEAWHHRPRRSSPPPQAIHERVLGTAEFTSCK
jgi:hypothetical protein